MAEGLTAEEIDRIRREARAKATEAIKKTITDLNAELGINIEFEEAPETITISVINKEGKEKTMGFMKVAGIEKVIEARLRFPDDSVEDALLKLGKRKKKKGV